MNYCREHRIEYETQTCYYCDKDVARGLEPPAGWEEFPTTTNQLKMSTQLHEIEMLRGKLQVTQFLGPSSVGPMLQLTQGFGSSPENPDEPGFIQLTLSETAELIPKLVAWMRDESKRRAERLREKIEKDATLEKTIFAEAAACERFIADFEVPKFAVTLLSKIVDGASDSEWAAGVALKPCEHDGARSTTDRINHGANKI